MRPIVSSISTPTYLMAKWLVNEMKKLPPIKSRSVKNSFDFVEKVKNIRVNDNEKIVSFDVVSLFPSIDVKIALNEFEKHLTEINVPVEKKQLYVEVAKTCMQQNYFQFRENFYKVEFGTNMGNPLSPLLSECFMAALEKKLSDINSLPNVWFRYVDDVFAVIKKDEINEILGVVNAQFPTIKFTCEEEKDNKLSFLDLQVTKKVDNSLEFSVYHKSTSTMRVITSDSFCPFQYKRAAFHSMAHRLCNLPLSIEHYKREYEYFKNVADVNGYSVEMIDDIIKNHANKAKRKNMSTIALHG